MKKIFLLAVAILCLHVPVCAFHMDEAVSIQMPDMRFYAVKAVNPLSKGRLDLLAAGQVKQDKHHDGLIMAFSITNGTYKELSREVFRIGPEGGAGNTRIRSLVCINEPRTAKSLVVVNGKGGSKNRDVGFVRSYVFDNAFKLVDSIEFADPHTSYTHGYPLIDADINGDGKNEIVCGGFSGKKDRDHAEIRFFSIAKDGHLAPIEGFQADCLAALQLRVNALTSGDFDGDGSSEVVAAGRTVEKDMERAAFALFSDQTLIWKQVNDLGTCRYRCATVTDMTGNGRLELILGGRMDQGGTSYGLLDVWEARNGDVHLISRYRFTGAGATRIRVVEPLPGSSGHLMIGGRQEVLHHEGMRWMGFLQQMTFESGTLFPCSTPVILDKDWETRVRAVDIGDHLLLTAGFTEDKTKTSTAFISVYQLK